MRGKKWKLCYSKYKVRLQDVPLLLFIKTSIKAEGGSDSLYSVFGL